MKNKLIPFLTLVLIISCGGGGGGSSTPAPVGGSTGGSSGGSNGTSFDMTYFLGGENSLDIELFLFKLKNSWPTEPDNNFLCTNILNGKIHKWDNRNAYFEITNSGRNNEYSWIKSSSTSYSFRLDDSSTSNISLKDNTYTSENSISLNSNTLSVEQMDFDEFSGIMNLRFTESSTSCVDSIDLNILTIADGYVIGFSEDGYGLFGYPRDNSVQFEYKDLWGEYDAEFIEMNATNQPSKINTSNLKLSFEEDPINRFSFHKFELSSDNTQISGFTTQLERYPEEPFSPIFISLRGNSSCPDFSASFYTCCSASCNFFPDSINVITSSKDEIISFDLETNLVLIGVKTLFIQ